MTSDSRTALAREHHRHAGEHDRIARRHRNRRNALVRQLHADGGWTHRTLAAAVGCSPELIAAILAGRV